MNKTNVAQHIASELLKIEAVFLKPHDQFTWASGIKSPIYCDNRITLSYPKLRQFITNELVALIKNQFAHVEVIAGVATAGIPQAALVAAELNLPLCYVRSSNKDHGRQNLIEGKIEAGTNVVLIEDLISTGKSSLAAADSLNVAELNILGLAAIFDYQLPISVKNFSEKHVPYASLSNYEELCQIAVKENYIKEEDIKILNDWRNQFES
jgi:orotate phosphoribosyltransferase